MVSPEFSASLDQKMHWYNYKRVGKVPEGQHTSEEILYEARQGEGTKTFSVRDPHWLWGP